MLKSKRGISPILATLLLIVIAVAAIVVTYAWIMTFMGNASQQADVIPNKQNIYWNSTDTTTIITLGNSGSASGKIVGLYLGTAQGNLLNVTASTNIGAGIILPPKSAINVVLQWPNDLANSWTAGNYYYFKAVLESGQALGPFPEQAAQ
jgi:flagellin-like protein